MTDTALPFVRVADLPVVRPFPLKFRNDRTVCVTYHETDGERIERAAALVTGGVRCMMLPKIIQS
jgi:hypothetical protein